MPYLLVIVVLALAGLRRVQGAAPEALGRPYQRGER
jgi:simple sugar transport system permease protein